MASYTVNISNSTGSDLILNAYDEGVGWKTVPPTSIPNGATGCFCNAGPNSAGGWAEYYATVGKDKSINVKWHWRIPAVGKNHCDAETDPKDYLVVVGTGGNCSGWNPTQDFTVQPVASTSGPPSDIHQEGDKSEVQHGEDGSCD
jgi:hypothetical protein